MRWTEKLPKILGTTALAAYMLTGCRTAPKTPVNTPDAQAITRMENACWNKIAKKIHSGVNVQNLNATELEFLRSHNLSKTDPENGVSMDVTQGVITAYRYKPAQNSWESAGFSAPERSAVTNEAQAFATAKTGPIAPPSTVASFTR